MNFPNGNNSISRWTIPGDRNIATNTNCQDARNQSQTCCTQNRYASTQGRTPTIRCARNYVRRAKIPCARNRPQRHCSCTVTANPYGRNFAPITNFRYARNLAKISLIPIARNCGVRKNYPDARNPPLKDGRQNRADSTHREKPTIPLVQNFVEITNYRGARNP